MLHANFHPFKTPNGKLCKLEDVFLQANGMTGHKYLVKDLKTKQISEINLYWQRDARDVYQQHVDGDVKAVPEETHSHLKKCHLHYAFINNET
jgi:hypothetical protein